MSAADEMQEKLMILMKALETHDHEEQDGQKTTIASQSISRNRRVYYLDLLSGRRRPYVRIAHVLYGDRTHIHIPPSIVETVHDTLKEFIKEHKSENDQELPESKLLHIGNSRSMLFDIGANNRGTYVRIQEDRPDYRTVITIPKSHFGKFCSIINELAEKMNTEAAITNDTSKPNNVDGEANPSGSGDAEGN